MDGNKLGSIFGSLNIIYERVRDHTYSTDRVAFSRFHPSREKLLQDISLEANRIMKICKATQKEREAIEEKLKGFSRKEMKKPITHRERAFDL